MEWRRTKESRTAKKAWISWGFLTIPLHAIPLMGVTGLESKSVTNYSGSRLHKSQKEGGAKSGAFSGVDLDDLAQVVKMWPILPDSTKKAIVAITIAIETENND